MINHRNRLLSSKPSGGLICSRDQITVIGHHRQNHRADSFVLGTKPPEQAADLLQERCTMLDQVFDQFRKASETTMQMQQEMFKQWTSPWTSQWGTTAP